MFRVARWSLLLLAACGNSGSIHLAGASASGVTGGTTTVGTTGPTTATNSGTSASASSGASTTGPGASSTASGTASSSTSAASGTTTGTTSGAHTSASSTSGSHTTSASGTTSGAHTATTSGSGTTSGAATTSGSTGTGLTFTIDVAGGPARQYEPQSTPTAVSPYVYGFNSFGMITQKPKTKWGILRHGGDATSDWNWTNDYTSAAADYCYNQQGDGVIAGDILAQNATSDGIPAAQAAGIAYIATVPNVDFVSGPVVNNPYGGGNPTCPGSGGTCDNTANFALACNQTTCAANANFLNNHPRKGSTFCTCEGTGCSGCAINADGDVYQDEFINYMKTKYSSGGGLFFMLDNEPNYWATTHPEVWPTTGALCSEKGTVTFDDVVSRNIEYASAIKSVWPDTKVFGPVVAGDGVFYAGDYQDPHLPTQFGAYYLGQIADAGVVGGVPLLDSFDIHFYTVGGNATDCMAMPRSFWDPNLGNQYTASQLWNIYNGYYPDGDGFFTEWYPPQIIKRVLTEIDTAYAGTGLVSPGMSISEYNFGCETTIAGGVAEADGLGVFGREGLFASTVWTLQSLTGTNYVPPAFDLYRNYDGNGSTVGDLAVAASTSDTANTSVYAFAHTGDASELELVAINKNAATTSVSIAISNAASFTTVTAYNLVDGNPAVVAVSTNPSVSCSGGKCSLTYAMPATSATTLVLR